MIHQNRNHRRKIIWGVAALALIAVPAMYYVMSNSDAGIRGLYDTPLPADAELVAFAPETEQNEEWATYVAPLSTSEIRSFFRKELVEAGWKSVRSTQPRRLNFENGHQLLSVVTPSARDTFILLGGRQ